MITSKKEHEKNGVLWKVSKNMIKKDESILVVPVEKLMEHMGEWQGLRTDSMNVFTECVREHGMFMLRSAAECDERYKQIIPYVVLCDSRDIFVMQRCAQASEQRLRCKKSIGVGGHIRDQDFDATGMCTFDVENLAWARREIDEEIAGLTSGDIEHGCCIGFINDDNNPVGRVHCGVVYTVCVTKNKDQIAIRDEHKTGYFTSIDTCKEMCACVNDDHVNNFETWSSIVLQQW
jgi:predicted NUDIX family phosphoesterase